MSQILGPGCVVTGLTLASGTPDEVGSYVARELEFGKVSRSEALEVAMALVLILKRLNVGACLHGAPVTMVLHANGSTGTIISPLAGAMYFPEVN